MHAPVNLKSHFVLTACHLFGPYPRPGMASVSQWRGDQLDAGGVLKSIDRAIATARRLHVPTCLPVTDYNATHKAVVAVADGTKHVGFGEDAAQALWFAFSETVVSVVGKVPVPMPADLPGPYDEMRLAMAAHFDRELQQRNLGSLSLVAG